jgi:uroporphyrinogen-III synthase
VSLRILVTRPAPQAAVWVRLVRAAGLEAVALPLIAIAPVDDPAALIDAWHQIASQRLVVFVSPNAARQFFALRPAAIDWPGATWAGSPGPGTTQALIALGVPAARIIEPAADAPQFDSESLWARLALHDWRDAPVLVVRGASGRDWLSQTLRAHGARVAHVAAYRRGLPTLDAGERDLLRTALDAPHAHRWFFSRSEAIANLAALAPGAEWHRAHAIATHPRIAERARHLGFASVVQARPSLAAVVACIQSIGP